MIVDLTLPLKDGMRGFAWEPKTTVERDGWNSRTLHIYSHAGTHMDSPFHFAAGPQTIDQIPLDRCCGEAFVVRLPDTRPGEWLTPAHLGELASTFPHDGILLLATGWSRYVDEPTVYRDQLPRIGDELATWCVDRGVKLLGVEPPSVANVNDLPEVTRIHLTLLGGNMVIVEGLTNLLDLPPRVRFTAAPLKIAGSDGSPCRAWADFPQDDDRAETSVVYEHWPDPESVTEHRPGTGQTSPAPSPPEARGVNVASSGRSC